jgi:hypothetical protein
MTVGEGEAKSKFKAQQAFRVKSTGAKLSEKGWVPETVPFRVGKFKTLKSWERLCDDSYWEQRFC